MKRFLLLGDKEIVITVNLSNDEVKLPEEIFKNKKILLDSENNNNSLTLNALEARIFINY